MTEVAMGLASPLAGRDVGGWPGGDYPARQVRLNDGAVVQTAEPGMVLLRVGMGPIMLLANGALCQFLHPWPRLRLLGNSNRRCCRIDGSTLVVYAESGRREWFLKPNSAVLVTQSGSLLPLDYDAIVLPEVRKVFTEWMVTVGKTVPEMPGKARARGWLKRFCD